MESLITFVCDNCRYRFKRKKDWNSTKCPYCGTDNSVGPENTVNKMLSEVE